VNNELAKEAALDIDQRCVVYDYSSERPIDFKVGLATEIINDAIDEAIDAQCKDCETDDKVAHKVNLIINETVAEAVAEKDAEIKRLQGIIAESKDCISTLAPMLQGQGSSDEYENILNKVFTILEEKERR